MRIMAKKEIGAFTKQLIKYLSVRNLLHLAKKKIKAIIKDIYETQKEFDDQLKRLDEMEKMLEQITQMKLEITSSPKGTGTIKKKEYKKIEQGSVSKPTIYNEKLDIYHYLRNESKPDAASQVKEVLRKIESGELQIGKGRRNSRNNESTKKEVLVQEPSLKKEEIFFSANEKKEEKEGTNTKTSIILEYMQKIQMIDRFIQKNENSEDFKKLYYVRRCLDLRESYIAKMRQSVLPSMCRFNMELRNFIDGKLIKNCAEEDIEMMNSNYYFLKELYENYLKEKEVEIVLNSICTKVEFINKKVLEEGKNSVVLIKDKVA